MSTVPLRRRLPLPGWLVPLLGMGALVAVLVGVVILSRQVGAGGAPPEPSAFVPPLTQDPNLSLYTVRQVNGTTLGLAGEKREGESLAPDRTLTVEAGTEVELLRRITPQDIRTGDVVNVVAIPNEVRNFSIHGIVVLPAGAMKDPNGIARSTSGFAGHEAARDPRDRPVLSSAVARLVPSAVILAGPGGDITLSVSNTAALYRLEPAVASAIREGDRIVLMGSAGSTPTAILVLPAQ